MLLSFTRFLATSFIILYSLTSYSQQDFSSIYKSTDPVPHSTHYTESIILHQQFLDSVQLTKNKLHIILGNFYLANDYVISSEYEKSMSHLLEVEEISTELKDTLILGRASHKKATLYALLQNNTVAVDEFKRALKLNTIAKDSFYIAITLEQLGAVHGYLKRFEESTSYYNTAIPMVEKHCEPKSLSTTLANYGNTLIHQSKYLEAIVAYKKSIDIAKEIDDQYRIVNAQQNLALAYLNIDSLHKSLELYYICKKKGEEEGWLDAQIYSYEGLAMVYEELGDTDSSLSYYKQYYELNDSHRIPIKDNHLSCRK